MPTGCRAEYDRLEKVLVHEPGSELLTALLWPEASSFEETFNSAAAAEEHREYQKYFLKRGKSLYRLTDLLEGHDGLSSVVRQALKFPQACPQSTQLEQIVDRLSPRDKIRILLERPVLDVAWPANIPSPTSHSMTMDPLSNLYFTRDQLIVTDRGVVLGRFTKPVRRGEQEILELALQVLGITPLFKVADPGTLEGGDFIPAGDWALLGRGPRTNDQGVEQLTTSGSKALGFPNLAVIKDPENDPIEQQQEMHLDTYFMLVSPDTCLVEETRVEKPGDANIKDRRPLVDIYTKQQNGAYKKTTCDKDFYEFLTIDLHLTKIILLSQEDQRAYGLNVMCLDQNDIIGSYSNTQEPSQRRRYEQKLAVAGVKLKLLDFTNIRKGFGSNHCMTQALLREVTR